MLEDEPFPAWGLRLPGMDYAYDIARRPPGRIEAGRERSIFLYGVLGHEVPELLGSSGPGYQDA